MKKKKLKKKSLCKLGKDDISDHLDEIKDLIREPKFICAKCARSANSEKMVCKAVEID